MDQESYRKAEIRSGKKSRRKKNIRLGARILSVLLAAVLILNTAVFAYADEPELPKISSWPVPLSENSEKTISENTDCDAATGEPVSEGAATGETSSKDAAAAAPANEDAAPDTPVTEFAAAEEPAAEFAVPDAPTAEVAGTEEPAAENSASEETVYEAAGSKACEDLAAPSESAPAQYIEAA